MARPSRRRSALAALAGLAVVLVSVTSVSSSSAAVRTSTGVRCTIVGSPGADMLVGTRRRDVICGRGGADVIRAGGGDDLVDAGTGADRVSGGDGSDILIGGGGNDTLAGGYGSDVVRADTGSDRVSGGPGPDRIAGGDGNDTLSGNDGSDVVSGQRGEDLINGGGSGDRLAGGAEDDELLSGSGPDSVDGGGGDNLCIVDSQDESVRCRYDEQAPVIVRTTVSPDEVDVTYASAKVTVRAHITDDTGVSRVQGFLDQGNNGVAFWMSHLQLVSGTLRDGWWQAVVTIPRWTPQARLGLDLHVDDRIGRAADNYGDTAAVQVNDADPDEEAPQLTLTSVSPASVDVTTLARKVTITVHGVDARAGIGRLDICLSRPGTPPSTRFTSVICVDDQPRSAGTAQDGTWTATLTIPKGSLGATYNVSAYAEDRVSNRAAWLGPDAYQAWSDAPSCCTPVYPFPDGAGRLDVTGAVADATPAWIDATTVSKTQLHTLAATDEFRVRVHALDAAGPGEGVKTVEAMLVSSESLGSDPQFPRATLTLTTGTVTNGWWTGDVVAPQGTPPGTYHLLILITDRAHGAIYTDPTGPFVTDGDYKPLADMPTLVVVDEQP
jgi:hypothetical protein